ncbi:glutamyl-tRNA synthetase [Rhodotorula toruloides]|uniref:Glutamyl-tRNA synthetase n=1 Tax=Rhodotorula toruloides TaxID=5286 RepID=A0A511KQM0_RHOTO|nr:glutamyl-tRNA synthetase [Rhodotorula toruloides]
MSGTHATNLPSDNSSPSTLPPTDYPSTPSFTPTSRFLTAVSSFHVIHTRDPSHPSSLSYHTALEAFVRNLSSRSTDERVNKGPGEALLLAANCQHVRRWEKPRSSYPEGLSGYKSWRTALNRFHASIACSVLEQSGYSSDSSADAALIQRVEDLLMKKGLARPPLPEKDDELRDPELQLFEDAICLTFLQTEFTSFASSFQQSPNLSLDAPSSYDRRAKLVRIVAKTWAKMTHNGRQVAVEQLVGGLSEELRGVVLDAVNQEGEKNAL